MPTIGDVNSTVYPNAEPAGLRGQALVKNSSTDYDYSWAHQTNNGPPAYVSAYWYDNRCSAEANNGSGSVTGSSSSYTPFYLSRPITCNQIGLVGINNGQGTAGNYYWGFISIDPVTLEPSSMISQLVTSTSSGAAGAWYTVTFNPTVSLPAGWNMLFAGCSSNNICAAMGPANAYRVPWAVFGATPSVTAMHYAYYNQSYPDPFEVGVKPLTTFGNFFGSLYLSVV